MSSLDTVLYRGKRVMNGTFRYRMNQYTQYCGCRAEQIVVLHCGILYAPDLFWLE